MPELVNPLNWNIIKRQTYSAQVYHVDTFGYNYITIPDIQVVARSPLLLVGVGSTKKEPTWKIGCWATQFLPFAPSSTTQFLPNIRQPDRIACQFGVLNLCQFPYAGVSPYLLNLSFPYWLEQASIEVWQYGEAMDGTFEPAATDVYTVDRKVQELKEALEREKVLRDETFNVEIIEGDGT